jgi:MFS family permease
MATDIKSISKHEALGKINAAASIAYLFGPLLGGLLADNQIFEGASFSTPFYLIGVLFVGLSVLAAIILQNQDPATKTHDKEASGFWSHFNLIKRLSVLFQNKKLRFLLAVSTFFTLAIDIFYEFGPVYLTAKWVLGPAQLIIYNSLLCVALAVGNGWLANFLSTRCSSRRGIIWATGGVALCLIGMVVANQPLFMMALFTLIGLAIGLGVTFVTVKISDSVPDAVQGEVMGVQLSLRVLGDAVICLIGGVLLLLSSKLILVLAAIISAAIMVYYAAKETKFK